MRRQIIGASWPSLLRRSSLPAIDDFTRRTALPVTMRQTDAALRQAQDEGLSGPKPPQKPRPDPEPEKEPEPEPAIGPVMQD